MTDLSAETSGSDDSPDCPRPARLSGIGGCFKAEPEDFFVEEIPSYEPSGAGEHLFLWIQKRDISAETLVETIASTLGISRDVIGTAGLKDRRAVTRQWVCVPVAAAEQVPLLNGAAIQVLRSELHHNKLKTGHLRGNRFNLLIRNVAPDALTRAEEIRREVEATGIPNEFGEQRFGFDGRTLELGMSLLKGTVPANSIPFRRRKFLLRLALSAAQSALFNDVLQRRQAQGTLQTVLPGDVMQVRASGGLFVAEDVDVEQERYDRRETVITGPLFGPKMKSPLHAVFELEQAALEAAGLSRDLFRSHKKLTPGGRRPLLMFPDELHCEHDPDGVRLLFALPSGSYATVVLQTFMGEQSPPEEKSESAVGTQTVETLSVCEDLV